MFEKEIFSSDQETWDAFVLEYGPQSGAFLQSWEWGNFQEKLGRRVKRIGFFREEKWCGVAQIIFLSLPFGKQYGFCPRGPVVIPGFYEDPDFAVSLSHLFRLEKSTLFLRTEPPFEKEIFLPPVWKFVRAVNTPHTLLLSLKPELDQLLANMHPKTRYNIRLAERKGVQIRFLDASRFEELWPLFANTAERDGFRLHAKSYYKTCLETLTDSRIHAFLAAAFFDGKPLAANLMIDYENTRTYLHGASSNTERQLMAPYLLHWALIQDAKINGMKQYDWWGIAGSDDPKDPWAGITRFKRGFGGEEISYPGTFDFVLQSVPYAGYCAMRALIRRLRF
ncbi:MAG: Pentaglycine interpeptide bridge formation protein [Candidatus Uhrbacteria bacterium GW2011_GWF2_41_16]|nr:MAG: Pentaglycine interpeptide bridge formation protein [Candidatus Uhrbacteria bacterium GW2011_GWF2_41_16]